MFASGLMGITTFTHFTFQALLWPDWERRSSSINLLVDLYYNIKRIINFEPEVDASLALDPMIFRFHVLINRIQSIILLLDELSYLIHNIKGFDESQIILIQVDYADFCVVPFFKYEVESVFWGCNWFAIIFNPFGVVDPVDEDSIL